MRRTSYAVLLLAMALPAAGDAIDMVRYVIPARVVDAQGHPITGLGTADFTAAIDGKKTTVESVEWIGGGEPASPAGRLVAIFLQTEVVKKRAARAAAQSRLDALAASVLDMVEPQDFVAVFAHESHLELRCDFTRDRERVRAAIQKAMEVQKRPALPPASDSGPALARQLDLEEMLHASSAGVALGVISRALDATEGQKAVVVAGWGSGELQNRRLLLDRRWSEALRLLRASRTPVIAPSAEVQGAVSGYYELALRINEELLPGEHRVDLGAERAQATVLVAPLTVLQANEPDPTTPPVTAGHLYLDALQALRDGHAEEAEALLTRAIGLPGAPDECWYERGLLRAARGEMTAAAEDLRAYLTRAPEGKRAGEARDLLDAWQRGF